MPNNLTLSLSEISKDDIATCGGKGASLGELMKIGTPVPEGFVVTTSAYKKFIKSNKFPPEADQPMAGAEFIKEKLKGIDFEDSEAVSVVSVQIERAILAGEIQKELKNEILEHFNQLKSMYVAVRSSATAEDTAKTSWAGQLSSFLNTSEENLLENVKRCWASLYSPRALHYRAHHGFGKLTIGGDSVAVVVQRMIDAEVSGITFTVHPVTKDENKLVIEAGWGLGEAMVQGIVTPDAYIIDKKMLEIVEENINTQTRMIVRKDGDTVEQEVPEGKQKKAKLSRDQAEKLAELCVQIEKHYRGPQDIEWAIDGSGKIWILQSRPITTI